LLKTDKNAFSVGALMRKLTALPDPRWIWWGRLAAWKGYGEGRKEEKGREGRRRRREL